MCFQMIADVPPPRDYDLNSGRRVLDLSLSIVLLYAHRLTRPPFREIIFLLCIRRTDSACLCLQYRGNAMNDFNRKVEEASARVNKTVADAATTIEKES